MLLAIDIGNTQIVLGVFDKNNMKSSWRLTTTPYRTADECYTQVLAFCGACEIKPAELSGVAISSVVPSMTAAFEKMVLNRMSHIGESFILKPYELPFIKIKYDSPRSVGADRICNGVAGYERFGGPLIIVDFGTATTFDVIEDDGAYKGGIICPGIETSSAELVRKAAKLTKVDFEFPDNIIGESTEKSLQSGIMYGELEMIDGLNRRIWKELGTECKVIATGGLAPVIAVRSETITEIVPFLVLDGLNRIYRKMQK